MHDCFLQFSDYKVPTPKPSEFACPAKNGKFPHPKDCEAYYVCEKNKHKLYRCPVAKLFNDKKLSCADASQVTCGQRIRPDGKINITTFFFTSRYLLTLKTQSQQSIFLLTHTNSSSVIIGLRAFYSKKSDLISFLP